MITKNKDYVWVPHADVVMAKACFLGTKKYQYVIFDEMLVEQDFIESLLSSGYQTESITLNGKSLREYIQTLLAHPETTLEIIHDFLKEIQNKWKDAIKIFDLSKVVKLKVSEGFLFFPGSISAKMEGDFGYSMVVTAIPKPYKTEVKAFYG